MTALLVAQGRSTQVLGLCNNWIGLRERWGPPFRRCRWSISLESNLQAEVEIEYDVLQASNQLAGAPRGFKLTQGAKLIWASTPSGIKCFVNRVSTVILTRGNMSDLKKGVYALFKGNIEPGAIDASGNCFCVFFILKKWKRGEIKQHLTFKGLMVCNLKGTCFFGCFL